MALKISCQDVTALAPTFLRGYTEGIIVRDKCIYFFRLFAKFKATVLPGCTVNLAFVSPGRAGNRTLFKCPPWVKMEGRHIIFIIIIHHGYKLEMVLDVIEIWIRISGYKYKSEMTGDTQLHIVQHDMGKKWSFYLAELYSIYRNLKWENPISTRRIRYLFSHVLVRRNYITSLLV